MPRRRAAALLLIPLLSGCGNVTPSVPLDLSPTASSPVATSVLPSAPGSLPSASPVAPDSLNPPSPSRVAPTPSPTSSPPPTLPGTWSAIPDAPIQGRLGNSTIWTGSEMIVWGGRPGPASVQDRRVSDGSDGAAYNPATRRWRSLSSPPIAGRFAHVAAWTGREMLVWGGSGTMAPYRPLFDGAAYTPATNTWRRLARSPLRTAGTAVSVWTGSAWVIVSGLVDNAHAPIELLAAAYDPVADAWRSLAGLRVPAGVSASIVWTGTDVLLVENPDQFVALGFQWRPGADRWQRIAASPIEGLNAGEGAWTGHELVIPASFVPAPFGTPPFRVFAYNPGTDTWRASRFPPYWVGSLSPIWTGRYLVFFSGSEPAAVYEPATDRWLQLPASGPRFRGFADAIWARDRLIAWGGGEGESFILPNDGIQFIPAGW